MFGSDDDTDFLPANKSKLSSLFGAHEMSGEENASFTFAAPKQPKKGSAKDIASDKRSNLGSVSHKTGSASSVPEALNIIIVKAVHTFILENGKFVPQGKLGAAVLGKSTIHWYQLLLYKGKQQHVASCKITPSFEFNVKINNYCSFISDQGKHWSILFEDHTDAEEFARQIGLARADSAGTGDGIQVLSSQEISVQSEENDPTAGIGDSMEIYYTARTYSAGKLGKVIESNRAAPQKVKIRKNVWEEGLIGASKGTKRIVMLPPNILGPWKSDVPPGTSLVIEVEVNRLQHARPKSPSGESAIDSSADEHSIKARGASISEALTNSPKTNKASIISRMARMGQATLPFKGAAAYHPSDSEETGDESSGLARPSTNVKTSKTRLAKTRPAPPPVDTFLSASNVASIPQQVAIYQQMPGSETPWQYANNSQLYKMPQHPGYVEQIPTNIISPTQHGELSVFLSEARTCNSEVRMAVTKVTDKVDQIMGKLQGVSSPTNSSSHMDPVTLLASISQIVEENQQLKAELSDKRNKLEVQSERIFSLLNTNHTYLEKSVNSDQEARTSMVVLLEEKSKLKADLEKITTVHKLCGTREESMIDPAKDTPQSESKARVLLELNAKLETLSKQLKTSKEENHYLEDTVSELLEQILEKQSSKESLQKGLTESKEYLNLQRTEAEQQIKNITSKYTAEVESLKAENEVLKIKLDSISTESENNSNLVIEVKKVMNAVWRSLQAIFIPGESYDGASIRQTLMSNIRDVTCQLVEQNLRTVRNTSSANGGTNKGEECNVITTKKQESHKLVQSKEKEVAVQQTQIEAVPEIPKKDSMLTKEQELLTKELQQDSFVKTDQYRSKKTIWTAPEHETVKQEAAKPEIKEIKIEDTESYRPQPPPLFDEEDDDNAWYM